MRILVWSFLIICMVTQSVASDHPVLPLISYAESRLDAIDESVTDYTCTLTMRERTHKELGDYAYASVKVRHDVPNRPFSVYMKFSGPSEIIGREVAYMQGYNNDELSIRNGGSRFGFVVVSVDPLGDVATADSHYPITEFGIRNLLRKFIKIGKEELEHKEVSVQFFIGAKIDDRLCTLIQINHPVQRKHFRYHIARIFIDDELNYPIRYSSYDWPKHDGDALQLIEEYTYTNIKFNVGLQDRDFIIK